MVYKYNNGVPQLPVVCMIGKCETYLTTAPITINKYSLQQGLKIGNIETIYI